MHNRLPHRYFTERRSDRHFSKLYTECVSVAEYLQIGQPEDFLPRQRRAPKKLKDFCRVDACAASTTNEFSAAEQFYAQGFNEVLDVLANTIKEKVDQETLQHLKGIED